jgi:hypothetical protein
MPNDSLTCQRILLRSSYLLESGVVSHVPLSFVCGNTAAVIVTTPTHAISLCSDCYKTISSTTPSPNA